MAEMSHPFFPRDLRLSPDYKPQTLPSAVLSSVAVGVWSAVLIFTYIWASARHLCGLDKFTTCWMFYCAVTHCTLEIYYAFNAPTIPAGDSILDEMFKDFSLSDSRYISGDTMIVLIEGITGVVLGPLCLITGVCFLYQLPYRRSLVVIIGVSHIYSTLLYFGTEFYDGLEHGPGIGSYYFWAYTVFMNSLFIVIPAYLVCRNLHIMENGLVTQTKKRK